MDRVQRQCTSESYTTVWALQSWSEDAVPCISNFGQIRCSFTLRLLHPQDPLDRRLNVPESRCGTCGQENYISAPARNRDPFRPLGWLLHSAMSLSCHVHKSDFPALCFSPSCHLIRSLCERIREHPYCYQYVRWPWLLQRCASTAVVISILIPSIFF
jgi:hypothetical protein